MTSDADSSFVHWEAPRAILVDLDDTVLDTTESATRVWRETARAFEAEIGRPAEEFDPVLDRARVWYWSDPERNRVGRRDVQRSRVEVTHRGLLELGIDDHALATRFADHYSEHRIRSMRPFPGAIETLAFFAGAGVPMALITNGDAQAQREKVEHFDLAQYFRAVLIEGELGYGKPDPRVFQEGLAACGDAPASGSWCVGDNLKWEVAAPQGLGMTGIWNDWEGKSLPAGSEVVPDRVVRRIAELTPPPGVAAAAGGC
ncbi:MAG: HAD family hydrolase [Planctomycetota bacterium]